MDIDDLNSAPRSPIETLIEATLALFVDEPPAPRRDALSAKHPWPQPSPWFPDRMLPAVLNVPDPDRVDWHETVCVRYRKQLLFESPLAYAWAVARPGVAEVSDRRFVALLCDGPVARFLTPELDPPDEALFASVMASERFSGCSFLKSDFRVMALVEPDAESEVAPTVVLFARDPEGDDRIAAIAIDDQVFEPDGSDAFALAKYFALQSAGVCVTLQVHPQLHFPFDTINAVARTRLPDDHVLRKLLFPHLRLELAVADAVLHSERSVLEPGHLYSAYPTTRIEAVRIVQTIWTGFPHRDRTPNRAYPPFRYPIRPKPVLAPYGMFLERYYEAVRGFVREVLAELSPTDADARDFARHVAHFLPGFPLRETEADRDDFVDAIATMIFTVSIAHTTDHFLYGEVDPREMPFRLRAPPPRVGDEVTLDRETLVQTEDTTSYAICSKMYFEPHPVETLIDVDYAFDTPDLRLAVERFHDALREVEDGLVRDGLRVYHPLRKMASSVQF